MPDLGPPFIIAEHAPGLAVLQHPHQLAVINHFIVIAAGRLPQMPEIFIVINHNIGKAQKRHRSCNAKQPPDPWFPASFLNCGHQVHSPYSPSGHS